MKKFSILALSATVAIAPAFAETTTHYNTPSVDTQTVVLPQTTVSTTTPQVDLSFAFDDVENLQTKDMTATEMQETEGAVAPAVAYGIRMGVMGTIGAGANAWNHHSNTGEWSWGAAGRGFVAGAVGGGAAKYLGGKGW